MSNESKPGRVIWNQFLSMYYVREVKTHSYECVGRLCFYGSVVLLVLWVPLVYFLGESSIYWRGFLPPMGSWRLIIPSAIFQWNIAWDESFRWVPGINDKSTISSTNTIKIKFTYQKRSIGCRMHCYFLGRPFRNIQNLTYFYGKKRSNLLMYLRA